MLDADGVIVFCNQSLLDAIGAAAIDLVGRRSTYRGFSPPSATASSAPAPLIGVEAAAAGLCPPPQAMAGQSLTATVSWTDDDGRLHRRLAQFVPLIECAAAEQAADAGQGATAGLTSSEQVLAVIALVDTSDLPESDSPLPQVPEGSQLSETVRLHDRLREFLHAAATRHGIERLIGDGDAMRLARRRIELASASRAGVLIVGPPGSGRRHVAETIHYASNGSLIPVDCSVLGADLIRSTVAALSAGSLSENSRQSTLLLNEADRLPKEVQAELAAVFSRKTFYPRLIATARRPLAHLVRKGRFREDLAALLSTIVIELPPLARRRGDLPLLAQMFVERENAAGGKQIGGFSPEALACLDGYDWPGNVDELALIVAESHANAASTLIAPGDLPKRLHQAAQAAAHPRRAPETIVLDDFLAEIERELIQRAIAQAKGNKAKAARMLGLSRPRLYRRLIQLGMERAGEAEEIIFEEEPDEEK